MIIHRWCVTRFIFLRNTNEKLHLKFLNGMILKDCERTKRKSCKLVDCGLVDFERPWNIKNKVYATCQFVQNATLRARAVLVEYWSRPTPDNLSSDIFAFKSRVTQITDMVPRHRIFDQGYLRPEQSPSTSRVSRSRVTFFVLAVMLRRKLGFMPRDRIR